MIKQDDRNGVVIYQLLLQGPDGALVCNIPIPVEITITGDQVKAEINGTTPWTPGLHETYATDGIPAGLAKAHGMPGADTWRQQELVTAKAKGLIVEAMKDAMQPYLASERTPITEEETPQTKLFPTDAYFPDSD